MKALARLVAITAILCLTWVTSGCAIDIPALRARVNDYANLLSPAEQNSLEASLQSLEERTTAQVAILTVGDLQGLDIKSFSMEVVEAWKLGQKGKDNGLLILYTVQEDRYRLEVGYGLEGAIPDGKAGEIIRQKLRTHADPKKGLNDFGGAFGAAVQSISEIVAAESSNAEPGTSTEKSRDDSFTALLILGLVITVICGSLNVFVGAVTGGLSGFGLGWLLLFGAPGLVLCSIGGALTGWFAYLVAKWVDSFDEDSTPITRPSRYPANDDWNYTPQYRSESSSSSRSRSSSSSDDDATTSSILSGISSIGSGGGGDMGGGFSGGGGSFGGGGADG